LEHTINTRADLHIHTNASDGILSPDELLYQIKNSGISIISITDHDSVASVDITNRRAERFGIQTIPGVELSAEYNGVDLHFLGYFIEHHSKRFLDYLYLFRRRRYQRAQEMVEKLYKLGIRIRFEQVVLAAGNGPIGRPHVADVLIQYGLVKSREDAFQKYLYNGGPVYVDKYCITAGEVIDLIHSIGGAAFIAHPGMSCSDEIIIELLSAGLDGIEVVHPKHTQEMVVQYTAFADEHGLLKSGGSDFHGNSPNEAQIGEYTISTEYADRIKSYCEVKRNEWHIEIDEEGPTVEEDTEEQLLDEDSDEL